MRQKYHGIRSTWVLDMHVQYMHIRVMKLADYMETLKITDARLAEAVGRDRTTVSRWRNGKARPDWSAFAAIEKATNGMVTARDFVEREAAQ